MSEFEQRVQYAYYNTQREYDEHPPKNDMVPVAGAINAWSLICGCYMGIEQTMKLLIRMRGGNPPCIHDLERLYSLLDPSDHGLVNTYYRVYRSLHNFDSGNIALDTAEDFIKHIGKGYVVWRYILVENKEVPPKIHLGLMLETWRALVDLVNLRSNNNTPCRTVDKIIEQNYIMDICRDAGSDDEWQAISQDENSDVKFRELYDWFCLKGRFLEGGIDLFTHHARGTGDSIQASPVLRRVLLRAAEKAVGSLPTSRRSDIAMFHQRIRSGGLGWNSDRGVFETVGCPS